MELTTNYGLKKPGGDDNYNVNDDNENMDKIDQELKTNADSIAPIKTVHTAAGTANALVLTTGGNFTYTNGACVKFKATANNTASVTINIDSKGIKAVKKPDGTQIPSSGLKTGKVYEIYFDTTGDCFFLLARAEGDAVAANVLAGKKFSNDDDTGISGSMPNIGTQQGTITAQNGEITISQGYHNGLGKIIANIANLIASNIKAGVTVGGILGTFTSDATAVASQILSGIKAYVNGNLVTGTMTNHGSKTYTPTTSNQTLGAGYINGLTVYGDAQLVAGNIKDGVNIFNVIGTLKGGSGTQFHFTECNRDFPFIAVAREYNGGYPSALIKDASGTYHIMDSGLVKLDKNGSFISRSGSWSAIIDFYQYGSNYFIRSGSNIYKLDSTATSIINSADHYASSICIDSSGNVYAVYNGYVTKFNSSLGVVTGWNVASISGGWEIICVGSTLILTCQSSNGVVYKCTTTGTGITAMGSRPYAFSTRTDGTYIYVGTTSAGDRTVKKIRISDGATIWTSAAFTGSGHIFVTGDDGIGGCMVVTSTGISSVGAGDALFRIAPNGIISSTNVMISGNDSSYKYFNTGGNGSTHAFYRETSQANSEAYIYENYITIN